jgi:DNA-damage-inducible protein J
MVGSRVSVNINEDIKQSAQRIFSEMGLDMTTAIDSFLRTVVREGRIPYELRTERAYREATHQAYINAALEESMIEANDPNAKRLPHAEVMASLRERREARNRV